MTEDAKVRLGGIVFPIVRFNHSMLSSPSHRGGRVWPIAIVACLCLISIVTSLDPAGSYTNLPEGPGLTVDEILNVEQGVYLVEQARALGWLNLVPGTSQEAYRAGNGAYNPDHPPLGRWWLGVHHHLTWWLMPPHQPEGISVTACARTGSATAFSLTVFLVGWLATRWSGRRVGVLTAISLILMPRLFGHAHLASLETITNLTCTCSVLSVAATWNGTAAPTRRAAILAGFILGFALLTKIQAILIPIPVIGWTLWRWRARAIQPLFFWGTTALLVFFLLWPYLWFDPVAHGLEYLGRTTNRSTIHVWYFGQKYADKAVPWHYPFVLFGVTVPLVLHGLGVLGLFSKCDHDADANTSAAPVDPLPSTPKRLRSEASRSFTSWNESRHRDVLILACMLFPLVVFALPGVAVYDGERLFLTSFPLWSIFIGRGWSVCFQWLAKVIRSSAAAIIACSIMMVFSSMPLVQMSPCHLCYYNELGMLLTNSKTNRPGMENDYWGVGITRSLLTKVAESVPHGATVAVLPTLHQFQAEDYRRQSPILRAHGIKMVEYRPEHESLLVYRRLADLPEKFDLDQPDVSLKSTIRANRVIAFFVHRNVP